MLSLKSLAIVFTFQIWAAFRQHFDLRIWGHIWASLGPYLGLTWASLEPHLGLTWTSLGPHLAQFGPLLGHYLATIGAPLYIDNDRYMLKKNI